MSPQHKNDFPVPAVLSELPQSIFKSPRGFAGNQVFRMPASVDDLRKSAISISVDVPNPFEFGEDAVLQVGGGCSAEPDVKKHLELVGIPCHDECPRVPGFDSQLRALLLRHSRKVVDQVDQFVVTSGQRNLGPVLTVDNNRWHPISFVRTGQLASGFDF